MKRSIIAGRHEEEGRRVNCKNFAVIIINGKPSETAVVGVIISDSIHTNQGWNKGQTQSFGTHGGASFNGSRDSMVVAVREGRMDRHKILVPLEVLLATKDITIGSGMLELVKGSA